MLKIKNSDFQRIHTEIVVLIIHFSTRNKYLALKKFLLHLLWSRFFSAWNLFLALKLIITPLLQCEFFSLALSFHFSFVMERYDLWRKIIILENPGLQHISEKKNSLYELPTELPLFLEKILPCSDIPLLPTFGLSLKLSMEFF